MPRCRPGSEPARLRFTRGEGVEGDEVVGVDDEEDSD